MQVDAPLGCQPCRIHGLNHELADEIGAVVTLAQEPAHRLAQYLAVQATRWGAVLVASPDKPQIHEGLG